MHTEQQHIADPSAETDTDRKILENVIALLESAPELQTEVDVSFFVRNCVVTVTGAASSDSAHGKLIARIREAEGVERVIDRLTDRP